MIKINQKIIWLWRATCPLCGYRSGMVRQNWIARFLALIHTMTRHPYGNMTIGCVDKDTNDYNNRTLFVIHYKNLLTGKIGHDIQALPLDEAGIYADKMNRANFGLFKYWVESFHCAVCDSHVPESVGACYDVACPYLPKEVAKRYDKPETK